jgi:hypothetical protein
MWEPRRLSYMGLYGLLQGLFEHGLLLVMRVPYESYDDSSRPQFTLSSTTHIFRPPEDLLQKVVKLVRLIKPSL